jgi:hypothetical protein
MKDATRLSFAKDGQKFARYEEWRAQIYGHLLIPSPKTQSFDGLTFHRGSVIDDDIGCTDLAQDLLAGGFCGFCIGEIDKHRMDLSAVVFEQLVSFRPR